MLSCSTSPELRHDPRALVLTAGLGTRLRPLSYIRAKAAVPIAGEALVRRIVRWLSGQGVRDLVLNLHHLPHTITGRLGDGEDLGARIRIMGRSHPRHGRRASEGAGPAGRRPVLHHQRRHAHRCRPPRLADAHARSKALRDAGRHPESGTERYGGPLVDDNGMVTDFVGRGSSASYLFVGVRSSIVRSSRPC